MSWLLRSRPVLFQARWGGTAKRRPIYVVDIRDCRLPLFRRSVECIKMRPINTFGCILLCIFAIICPPAAFAIRIAVDKEELLCHPGNLFPLCISIGLTLLGWLPGSLRGHKTQTDEPSKKPPCSGGDFQTCLLKCSVFVQVSFMFGINLLHGNKATPVRELYEKYIQVNCSDEDQSKCINIV